MGLIGSSGGGYATVNPTQGNPIGEAMQNVENSAFKYRAEKREQDQIKAQQAKAQKDTLDAEAKDMLDFSSKHKIVPTTIDSVNKASLDFTLGLKQSFAKHKGILNSSNNPEERTKSLEALSNLDDVYEAYKSMPEFLNTSAKDLEAGVSKGIYNADSSTEAAKTIEAMSNGSMKTVIGSDGIPKFITYKRDSKGNLTDIIDKELTTEQVKLKLSPIMAYDEVKLAEEFKKSLGDKVKNDVGNKIIEGYSNLPETAQKKADAVVTDRSQMYAMAKLAGIKPKFDLSDYTPDEVEKVKTYVKESLTEKYKESVTENDAKLSRAQAAKNHNDSIAISRANLAIAQKKASLEEQEKNTVTVGTTEYKFTDIGTKAKKDFYAKPENKGKNMTGEDWPAGSFTVVRTSKKVVSGTQSKPTAKEAPKKYAGIDPKTGKAIYK